MSAPYALLSPRNDVVFELLFTRTPDLLRAMLEAVLARHISSLSIRNPENSRQTVRHS